MDEKAIRQAESRAQRDRLHALTRVSDALLCRSLEDGWSLPEADAVNAARLPLWLESAPRAAVERAIATAEALDRVMEALPADMIAQLPRRRQEPAAHRADHLDEIERTMNH